MLKELPHNYGHRCNWSYLSPLPYIAQRNSYGARHQTGINQPTTSRKADFSDPTSPTLSAFLDAALASKSLLSRRTHRHLNSSYSSDFHTSLIHIPASRHVRIRRPRPAALLDACGFLESRLILNSLHRKDREGTMGQASTLTLLSIYYIYYVEPSKAPSALLVWTLYRAASHDQIGVGSSPRSSHELDLRGSLPAPFRALRRPTLPPSRSPSGRDP
ncbi:hypothetical protein C8R43DRAFT_1126487 [Mycena crocata]|nr:hypothetical protein C8R43DRAFT_1126487 [Mycena crocata]